MKNKPFRWGIMGCGIIAPRFYQAMEKSGEGRIVAAASKSMWRAKRFRKKTGVDRIYNSYQSMLESEQLDAVYIANTHNFHAESALLCLSHRIPVLVEKAFTQDARQASSVISLALKNKTFAMEAMWTRFNPATQKLRELLSNDAIGDIQTLEAEFCVRMHPLSPKMWPWNRMYSPKLAGGALLDIGIYPISLASMIFGQPPLTIESSSTMAWTGVDKSSEYLFGYENGSTATMKSSFVTDGSRKMVIRGTNGSIEIPTFYRADKLTLNRNDTPEETLQCDSPGFEYQIREVHRCLKDGLLESPIMPLNESLSIMRTLDTIRTQWVMEYPGERHRLKITK